MTLHERTAQKRVPEHWLPLRFGPHMWVAWLGQGRGRTIVEQGSPSFGRGSNAGFPPLAGMHLQLPNPVILMAVFSYLRVGANCDRQVVPALLSRPKRRYPDDTRMIAKN